jgi:hypothetical protein
MEEDLENFVNERIGLCDFGSYYSNGYIISFSEARSEVKIGENKVEINLKMPLAMEKGEDQIVVNTHKISVKSKLGSLYEDARKIYDYEQDSLFLENYGVDILRLYAPVDGVELTCAPLVWTAGEVFEELQGAIEANTLALKVKNGAYTLNKPEDKYFVLDVSTENDVFFLNSRNWSYSFEVDPSEGSALIAKPVGNQQGMNVLGFCYVPYHFVYNMKYPVLVQIMFGEEIFQFPFAVVIQGNKPREALDVTAIESSLPEICEHANTEIGVNVYDNNVFPVEAEVSYDCFGRTCRIGKTSTQETFYGMFPQCANGQLIVTAEGFRERRGRASTVETDVFDVYLDRAYEKEIVLKIGGTESLFDAIISFSSEEDSQTILYPEQKTVKLSEGQYEIQVSIYRNTSIKLAETVTQECVDVPQSGLGGIFGVTKEKCFDIVVPPQIISNAIAGGGTEKYYILESELEDSNFIEVSASSLPTPKSLEDLQKNYDLFEAKGLDIRFI